MAQGGLGGWGSVKIKRIYLVFIFFTTCFQRIISYPVVETFPFLCLLGVEALRYVSGIAYSNFTY